jgi:outer membrane murein-binding lipoprotein Lpp
MIPPTKSDRIAELEQKVSTLESTIERLDADRKTFVRHAQTTARNVRRLMAENRAYRTDIRVAASTAARDIRSAIADPIAATRRAFK